MKTTIVAALVYLAVTCVIPTHGQTLEWTDQFGTSAHDRSVAVSADGLGGVYITGYTEGNLEGTNAGKDDAFLSRFDANGTLQWTRQLGTSEDDQGYGVSADGLGNVYITGNTKGSLGGTFSGGFMDAFISKYDASGAFQWTRQLGTSAGDFGWAISADGLGNVYISGNTSGSLGGTNSGGSDAFISKYDASGAFKWTQQFGTSEYDGCDGISADGLGNVYITGYTAGSLEGANAGLYDGIISKYDASGAHQWTQQFGTDRYEQGWDVSADGLGNVYISGEDQRDYGEDRKVFTSKYDVDGTLLWTEQLDSGESDWNFGVSADGLGNVYISGHTSGDLQGTNAGQTDAFIRKYDANGAVLWTEQLGTITIDNHIDVSADGHGGVYITGGTWGDLEGTNAGGKDGFLAKFIDGLAADFNGDGKVDGADLADPVDGWKTRFGVDLDGSNFLDWQREFGRGVAPLSAAQAAPEPSSLLLALAAIVMLTHTWKGRR
jgi:hypothetical protein